MPSTSEQPATYTLGVLPNPLRLGRALLRPNKPFVMVNLLSFKAQATGAYSHLSGQEAYDRYAKSVGVAQGPLGSRLLWAGQVEDSLEGEGAPEFQVIALLQYASPRNFVRFATAGNSDTAARSAGLLGQWLLASTTLAFIEAPPSTAEHRVLVELWGRTQSSDSARLAGWDAAKQAAGGRMIWHGKCDHHILGGAHPAIGEIVVTWFPSRDALAQARQTPEAVQLREARRAGTSGDLVYSAISDMDSLPELR